MDYNATTPLEPEVIQAVSEALQDAWGNPSSNYIAGEETQSHLLCVFGSRNVNVEMFVFQLISGHVSARFFFSVTNTVVSKKKKPCLNDMFISRC